MTGNYRLEKVTMGEDMQKTTGWIQTQAAAGKDSALYGVSALSL